MSHKCNLDHVIKELDAESFEDAVNEAAALELEYIKVCKMCREFLVCTYLHISLDRSSCEANLMGISISVGLNAVVDEKILSLLKYASMIISNTNTSVFYITKEYSLGVYYMLCRDVNVKWSNYKPVDYEEVRVFMEE